MWSVNFCKKNFTTLLSLFYLALLKHFKQGIYSYIVLHSWSEINRSSTYSMMDWCRLILKRSDNRGKWKKNMNIHRCLELFSSAIKGYTRYILIFNTKFFFVN